MFTPVTLYTHNPSKVVQIRDALAGLPVNLLSLDEAGIEGEAVEDGATLAENAVKKALFAWERCNLPSLADDTGFFIDALDGLPGIHAARWAGEGVPAEVTRDYTLKRLEGVPLEKRTARFETVAALVNLRGQVLMFTGSVTGRILMEPRIECQPKMPYSGIFVPDGQEKTFAEMSVSEENALSHRGKAFAQVRNHLAAALRSE